MKYLCFLFSLFLLMGCTLGVDESELRKPVKIGFVMASQDNKRSTMEKGYFEQTAKQLNAEVFFENSQKDVSVQDKKVRSLLKRGIDVLVMQPVNGHVERRLVELAEEKAVPVISYGRLITQANIHLLVSQNDYLIGVSLAEAAATYARYRGNVVVLRGRSNDFTSNEIARGIAATFRKYPQIKTVLNQTHRKASIQEAKMTVENVIKRYPKRINAFLAADANLATGAAEAIEALGLQGKIFLAGAGATLKSIRRLVSGKQSVLVVKASKSLADSAASAAVTLGRGRVPRYHNTLKSGKFRIPIIYTAVDEVLPNNIRTKIVERGYFTRAEVYGVKKTSE